MKQLDWKSFAIGVLLTTTVMLGTAAATSTTEKWDADQKWAVIQTNSANSEMGREGYEPYDIMAGRKLWRKRVQ